MIDNGQGVEPEELGKLKDSFFGGAQVKQGCGLRLRVVNRLADLLQARTRLNNEAKAGLSVVLRLKRVEVN